MSAIRYLHLLALALAAASAGCGSSRLFSRSAKSSDLDEPQTSLTHCDASPSTSAASGFQSQLTSGQPEKAQAATAADANAAVDPLLPVSEHLSRAIVAFDEQRYSTARQHLEAIIGQQPGHPQAHHRLAVISDLEGRFGDAEHHYRAALQADPNNAAIIGDLGYCYLLQGRPEVAEQYLLRARALDPSEVSAAQNLAVLYGRRGDVAGARNVLSEIYPPPKVQQTLAQLFPGLTPEALAAVSPPAPTPPVYGAPQNGAPDAYGQFASDGTPAGGGHFNPQAASGVSQHQTAMVVSPDTRSTTPNAAPPGATYPGGRMAVAQPFPHIEREPVAMQPADIAQTSVDVSPATSGDRTGTGTPARRWPPSIWPPQSGLVPATQPEPTASSPSVRPTSGVTYLMQRRASAPQQAPAETFPADAMNPASAPTAGAGAPMYGTPPDAGTGVAPPTGDAQYASGPGSSRATNWSDLTGQSVDAAPRPRTGTELRAAAAANLASGTAPTPPTMLRSSPGTAAGWNGGLYPTPPRQLPGSSATVFDYPPQGAPVRAAAPPTSTAAPPRVTAVPPPHPGFVIAPDGETPANPLSDYEADRRRFDQRFQQQVDQTYARSPANFVASPSASIPAPVHELPAWQPQTGDGAPVGPGGTPWYGRPAESPTRNPATAGVATAQSYAPGGASPAVGNAWAPNAQPTAPSYYRQAQRPDTYGYDYGPTINPAQ